MTMRVSRRATRDQAAKPNDEQLPVGDGGTITRGPIEPIALLEILERAAHGASGGGAVAGAAHGVAEGSGRSSLAERGIALSDGSRICFASIVDARLVQDEDMPMLRDGQIPEPDDSKALAPNDGAPRATANSKARVAVRNRARDLVSV
jgi:hypothetical protein